jgi:hypothetical protein
MAVKRDGITRSSEDLECFRNGFKVLLRDFSYYLSKKDLDGYYRGNKVIARQLANNDVSFSKFVKAFHLFEESYKDHLVAAFHLEDLVNALGTIDLLHHARFPLFQKSIWTLKTSQSLPWHVWLNCVTLRRGTIWSVLVSTQQH